MFCHRCGVEVQPKQRYCGDCGASLAGVTEPTEELVRPASGSKLADPVVRSAATGGPPSKPPPRPRADPVTEAPAGPPTPTAEPAPQPNADQPAQPPRVDRLAVTQAVTGVFPSIARVSRHRPKRRVYDFAADEPDDITHPIARRAPVVPGQPAPGPAERGPAYARPNVTTSKTIEMPLIDRHGLRGLRFRVGVVTGTSVVAAVVALVGAFAIAITITTDAISPVFETGDWLVRDMGSNLQVAGLMGVGALLVGGVAAGFGMRWGAGLAGGAGLAVAGWAALVIGLLEQPVKAATAAAEEPTTESFTVTITRDLGYWLLLATIVIGGAVFVVSLMHAGNDNRSGLNPWIAALGAVSALVAAGGPLVPQGAAAFSDNLSTTGPTVDLPVAYLAGRIAQVALVALAGAVGFLQVRRWGLGVVIGGMLPVTWLAATALLELGDTPVGPAVANPGTPAFAATPGTTVADLHAVTVVGMTALAGLAIVAAIAAYDQTVRERP